MPEEKSRPLPSPSTDEKEKSKHIEKLLDEALEETFPASDPVAVDVPHEHPGHPVQR